MHYLGIFEVYKRELKAYFFSPIAYMTAIVFFLVGGVFFWPTFFIQNQAELRGYFSALPWILTFVVPSLTMRLFAEERQTGSFEILLTLPLTQIEVTLGKFLAVFAFLCFLLLSIFLYGFSVELVGSPDWGPIVAGFVGAAFLVAFYAAIGIFASSLTKNQIVAFLLGLVISMFFFLIDKFFIFLPSILSGWASYISSDYHFKNIARGVIDSRDLLFFVFFTVLFLLLTVVSLQKTTR